MKEEKSQGVEMDSEIASCYAQQLDKLMSNMYEFVDIADEDIGKKPIVEPCTVEHIVSFHFFSTGVQNDEVKKHLGRRRKWMPKPKFYEKITYEDMCSVVVTGEWVLKRQGIFGKGRERRSELVTGIHSPELQHPTNKR